MAAILVITPKTSLTGKFVMAPYHILLKQRSVHIHCHFGFKQMLNFVYFHLDDIYFQSEWRPVLVSLQKPV